MRTPAVWFFCKRPQSSQRMEALVNFNALYCSRPVVYKPTKEHLRNEIPAAVRAIDDVLNDLKQQTGADDRYLSLILSEIQREKERSLRVNRFTASFN